MIGGFPRSEALVLRDEGSAYTNNPKDNGGPTKLGITQRALSDWLGHPATVEDVKALTPQTVAPIYEHVYWAAVHGDELSPGLDYFAFDSAVQHGRARAVKILQAALGLTVDGKFGSVTRAALKATAGDMVGLIERARLVRLDFYRSLDDWPTFGTGWGARLTRVSLTAKAWARKGVIT